MQVHLLDLLSWFIIFWGCLLKHQFPQFLTQHFISFLQLYSFFIGVTLLFLQVLLVLSRPLDLLLNSTRQILKPSPIFLFSTEVPLYLYSLFPVLSVILIHTVQFYSWRSFVILCFLWRFFRDCRFSKYVFQEEYRSRWEL